MGFLNLTTAGRDDFCMDPTGRVSFAMEVTYDLYTVQMVAIAIMSTIFNVHVLYFHYTSPPHPKFLLLWDRRLSICMHVVAGSVEIFSFAIAWFAPLTQGMRNLLVYVNVSASTVHILTATYQLPLVAGVPLVMRPAYACCIGLKALCALDVFLRPHCALTVLRLYNMHSVYTWCRVFYFVFEKLIILRENRYTLSFLLASFMCFPSCGPGVNLLFSILLSAYAFAAVYIGPPKSVAWLTNEPSRDVFENPRFKHMVAGSLGDESGSPFGQTDEKKREVALYRLFEAIDVHGKSVVSFEDLEAFADKHQHVGWEGLVRKLKRSAHHTQLAGFDFPAFKRFVGTQDLMTTNVKDEEKRDRLRHILSPNATYEDKARFMWDTIEQKGNDRIRIDDLAYFLLNLPIPFRDVQRTMETWGTDERFLSFEWFGVRMKPVVEFEVEELRARIATWEVMQRRANLAVQDSQNLVGLGSRITARLSRARLSSTRSSNVRDGQLLLSPREERP
mmetsp:Transcript_21705/g.68744  ORF Transcript_21705/g.68744 Transcript_21705/m.68744 type:complete len:504 (-) Transcript_21705:259-1770(-)